MNNKMIIAGGAAVLLAGVLFIVFSSNEEIAEVIQNVETEANEQKRDDATTTIEETTKTTAAQPSTQPTVATVASPNVQTNTVILGELEGGIIVTVPQATLTKEGFVVLYRINSNGESSIAGKSDLLSVGTHNNIKIQLTATVPEMQAIVAVLHMDNGNGKFEQGTDAYLLNDGLLVSDIDVVGVKRSDRESRILETKIEAYLETNFEN